MPIYDYRCERCGKTTEAIQRFVDPPLTECPKCGGPLRKLVSAPAFQFKGSGWYVTDYARKGEAGEKSSAASDTGGGDDSSAGPAKKADSSAASSRKTETEAKSKPEPASKSSKD